MIYPGYIIEILNSDGGRELKAVLTEADAALYVAKQTGRNRVAHLGALPASDLAPA